MALQTADPSCRTTTTPPPIYVDCGNGTVTDNRTGLVWLANANCLVASNGGAVDWHTAMEFVAGLSDKPPTSAAAADDCGLSDGSSPGEWRLPSVEEWEAMIADAIGDPGDPDCTIAPPTITNDSGGGCLVTGPSSFFGLPPNLLEPMYWSSSTAYSFFITAAWVVNIHNGTVTDNFAKGSTLYVWPVRGGQ